MTLYVVVCKLHGHWHPIRMPAKDLVTKDRILLPLKSRTIWRTERAWSDFFQEEKWFHLLWRHNMWFWNESNVEYTRNIGSVIRTFSQFCTFLVSNRAWTHKPSRKLTKKVTPRCSGCTVQYYSYKKRAYCPVFQSRVRIRPSRKEVKTTFVRIRLG